MRQLTILTLLLACQLSSYSQHDWQWLNPKPTGYDGIKITFTDPQHGFILDYQGELMRTSDQGAHWEITNRFGPANAMEIAHSTGVIALTNGSIYVSPDNGNTWNLSPGMHGYINWISIVSRDTFYLAMRNGQIYKTTDRGLTMTTLDVHSQIACFTFLDSKTGFAGATLGTILKTTDGGLTWIRKASVGYFPSTILSFQFLSADTGFAFRDTRTVLKTYDGGNTWTESDASWSAPVIQFINSKTGFAAGEDGIILRTDDGGVTWNSVSAKDGLRYGYQIYSVYFFDEHTGFTVGGLGRILKTTDGGQTWSQYATTYIPITSVAFPTAQIGYMSTWTNTFKTTDGGQTWDSLTLTTGTEYASSSRFTQAHFSSADTGYFLSNNEVREHRTTDGGKTWSLFNPAGADWTETPGEFWMGPHTGFITIEETQACCGGQLLKTVDDGASWSPVWGAQFNSEWLGRIFFVDSLNGFALRYQQLMKTTDGGLNWSVAFTHPDYPFSDLWFFDPLNGIVTNESGQMNVTHDGGKTFTRLELPQEYMIARINTMKFFNRQIGYFIANNLTGPASIGQIYKTIDSGQTWQLSLNAGGNSIIFTPDSNIVVAGYGGALLKNKIRNWQVNDLTVRDDHACGEIFSVKVGAALSDADSISILYTAPNGKTDTVAVTPNKVQNTVVTCTASAKAFIPNVVYTARVRLKYDGVYQMSEPVYFTPSGLDQPHIWDSAGYLVSNIDSANHWYRNGIAIPGALGRRYYADSSGVYAVQTRVDSCFSAMSDPITINLACTQQPVPAPTVTYTGGVLTSSAYVGNRWYINGTEIPVAYDQTYTPTVSGDYSVRILTACSVSPTSGIVAITLACNAQQPVPAPTVTNNAGVLSSSVSQGNHWYLNGIEITDAHNQKYTPLISGDYSARIITDCTISEMSNIVNTVVSNSTTPGPRIYPNPVTDHLVIDNPEKTLLEYEVMSIGGRSMLTGNSSEKKISINTRALPSGQYILRIKNHHTNATSSVLFLKQ